MKTLEKKKKIKEKITKKYTKIKNLQKKKINKLAKN